MVKDLKDIFKKGFDEVGRPKIVKTVEELIEGINSYYNSILVESEHEGVEPYFYRPTITGLALVEPSGIAATARLTAARNISFIV